MADYPGAIYSPRTKTNRSGVVYDAAKETVIFAEDISKDDAEVVAIETELGLNPKGGYASVVARLNALAAKSIFDKFLDLVHWVSIDGFYEDAQGFGYCQAIDGELQIYTGSTLDDWNQISSNGYYRKLFQAAKVMSIEFQISNLSSITTDTIRLYLVKDPGYPSVDTENGIGFKIINGLIYGYTCNGAANTITTTATSLATGAQQTRLRIVFTPGTDCKFYVNDVLKLTITTTLATDDASMLYLAMSTQAAAGVTVSLGRILIEKEY